MKDEQIDMMMKKLKNDYNNLPIQSSTEKIIAHIKKDHKHRRRRSFRGWKMVALFILALGIGSVITMSQLANFTLEEEAQVPEVAMSEERMAIEKAEIESVQEQPTEDHSTFDVGESDEANMTTFPDEDVKEIYDNLFGLHIFIPTEYIIDDIREKTYHSLHVYANFDGKEETKIEPHFFSVTDYYAANDSVASLQEKVETVYAEKGYEQVVGQSFFLHQSTALSFVEELTFEGPASLVRVGIVEHNGSYYAIAAHFFGELYDQIESDVIFMLEHATFAK